MIPRRSSSDAELGEPPGDVAPVGRRIHLLVDEQNPSIPTDIEGPSKRVRRAGVHDAIRGGDAFVRIAQQWVVRPDLRGELAIGFGRVDTGRE